MLERANTALKKSVQDKMLEIEELSVSTSGKDGGSSPSKRGKGANGGHPALARQGDGE